MPPSQPPSSGSARPPAEPPPTRALVARARAGSEAAWDELFARYRPMLALLARARLGQRERRRFDTEDVLAHAFAAVARDLERFEDRGPGSLRAWLAALVTAKARDLMRSERAARRDRGREQPPGSGWTPAASGPGPATQAAASERDAALLDALATLSPEDQQLISMRTVEELSWEATAVELSMSVGTTRRRYARALERLARALLPGVEAP